MSTVLDRLTFVEYREEPNGVERYGVTFGNRTDELIAAHCVSFRTRKDAAWLASTAGSVILLRPATWAKWSVVEDPLAV